MNILFVIVTLVFSPVMVLAGGREDREDGRIRAISGAAGVITDEVMNLKTRVKALEAAPRQNEGNSPSRARTADPNQVSAIDEDMREAFFVREGLSPDMARAAATTRDWVAGRQALLSVAQKGFEREEATVAALEKLARAQAQTSIVLEKGLGKKFSKIARDYGFK